MDPYDLEESPRVTAGILSKILFWWMTPLFLKGRKKALRIGDLYRVLDEDRSKALGDKLQEFWERELKDCKRKNEKISQKKQPSFFKVLIRVFGFRYLVLGILVGIEELVVQIGQPLCLGLLIRYFESETSTNQREGFFLVAGVVLGSILFPLMHHTYFFQTQRQGMQIRIACSSLIYRKALKLNVKAKSTSTAGQIVNLLSNDASRFDSVLGHLHFMWVAPIQLAIVIYILWGYFKLYCLIGVIILVLFGPFQGVMGRFFGKLRLKTAVRTDKRMRILNEVISAIQTVKIYAWESLFSKMVTDARKDEISWIRRTAGLRAINATLFHISSKLVVFITLLVYVLAGNSINSEKVFVTMALYNSVRQVFTFFVPLGVSQFAETMISIRRIQEFLLALEKVPLTTVVPIAEISLPDCNDDSVIRIQNFNASWGDTAATTDTSKSSTLSNISLDVKRGSLVAIVGQTGSGKSSLLHSLLRELTPTSGSMETIGSLSYASQEPWIFEGTVRENILFGRALDIQWYNKVVDACALRIDIASFSYGDQTIVGDKGTSLSGGQKARINLARTIYSNADIVLLDTPLSAVDTKVASHIFNECILGLLKEKTRVLVTHQIQFLPQTDQIVLIENGSLRNFASFAEFDRALVGAAAIRDLKTEETDKNSSAENQPSQNTVAMHQNQKWVNNEESEDEDDQILEKKEISKSSEDLISTSNKSFVLYAKYFRAGAGSLGIAFLVASNLLTQTLYTGSDYWLQFWVKSETSRSNETVSAEMVVENNSKNFIDLVKNDRNTQIYIYSILFGSLVIASFTRTVFYFGICMKSSVSLHDKLFSAVIRAPIKFFEDNSTGKILNVFAKDIGIIDELLPVSLFEALEAALNVAGVLVIVSIVNTVLIGPAAFVVILFYLIRRLYLRTARNVKRLEGVTKGPVFSHMSSTFNGIITIRAFGAEERLKQQFDAHQDLHSCAWFLVLSTTRWLAFVVESISVAFITCVTLSFMLFNSDGPSVGLAISSAMTLTGMFQWGVRQSAETENQMISVERVSQYSKVNPEPPLESFGDAKPGPDWPSEGKISFNAVTVLYGDKTVLQNLSFVINGGEKIGVVGRTGAGKSTLVSCLFRLIDPHSGHIEIDRYNIYSVGLHELRPKISIIPQEPVLFNGTLRQNLDPTGRHSDDEIWSVIKQVNLEEILVGDSPRGLNYVVEDRGLNFSVGQKQLICLGRALLQKNRIIVLDEATASLDKETDSMIQKTIRENFTSCTVLTVAHRLDTIIHCDRILVLDAGRIVEFDAPFNLLTNAQGHFSKMINQLSESAAESLRRQAAQQMSNL